VHGDATVFRQVHEGTSVLVELVVEAPPREVEAG
jgi:hypothetical protein